MITLLYHDVVEAGHEDASGFPGPGAARYKLTPAAFRDHLAALAEGLAVPPTTAANLANDPTGQHVLITFDDGGKSAVEPIADMLDQRQWRGHFFVTAKFVDTAPFVSTEQIRLLHRRGHVIGSHSFSHPPRMAQCSWEQLVAEWSQSCALLADIVGEPITVASVPGGHFSKQVAQAAALAGIRVLFNSEPTRQAYEINGCLIVGRYTVYEGMRAGSAAALVSRWPWRRLGQTLTWKVKKVAKAVGGRAYLAVRERLLSKAYWQT
jgi:peptidoglycan/xylan/chitin deacetylase (PgdA/CDA1 family)